MLDSYYDEPASPYPCHVCHGNGYTSRSEHSPHCDGNSCERLCPVDVQELCEECGPTYEQYLSRFVKPASDDGEEGVPF